MAGVSEMHFQQTFPKKTMGDVNGSLIRNYFWITA